MRWALYEQIYIYINMKHVNTRNYGYELVCADDKFSKPFKLSLGEDAV